MLNILKMSKLQGIHLETMFRVNLAKERATSDRTVGRNIKTSVQYVSSHSG